MKISKKINRIIASSLSLAMVSSMTSVFPVFAETTESADFVYDNYSVSYNVTDSWGNTEKVSITLTNTSENPIENWMLYFDPNGEVTSMWDVTTAFTANNVPYFKNAGYNSTITPNDSVTFNYFVDNCESIPDSYTLCQKRVEKSEGYDVDVVVDSSWGEGFNGTIIITNSTDKPIEDWELVFDTNFTITEITSSWSGTMTALEPYSYMLKGSYTSVIEPNSSVRLGFSGVKDGEPVITDTVLTEVVADEALINFKFAYSDGVELYAFGNYNNEDNAVDIEWYTNYTNGDYEIWTSDDNSTYTSVAVVSDSTEYQYPITENFEKRYFKVSLDVGFDECIESVPFVVTKSETGYSVDFLDSDEDGLPDIFELQLGTNVNEPDSDGDDLTDYQEVYITGTDPTVYDSVTSGVSDAEADSDDDRLSNAQEIELGTNPQLSDTDDDGLSDYDEIYVYETDPLNPDSDGDGLQDGDEPHIGLDPTNPETFGIPDAEYKVAQTVQADSKTLSYINTPENPYSLSINLNAVGYAENALSAEISSYTNVLSSNTAIVGNIVSLDYLYDEIEDVTLNFEMSSDYLDSMGETTVEGLELEGINRLYAFHYDEVNNILYPVETEISGNTVVVHASKLGDYCLIDLNTWLEMLDISSAEDEEIAELDVYSMENYTETEENIDTEKVFQDDVVIVDETIPSNYEEIIEEQINDVIENIKAEESIAEESETISTFSTDANTNNSRKKIDLVYVIDTSGSMSSAINAAKSSMSTLFNNLYNNGIDASVAVVTYSDYICDKENGAIIQPKNSKNKWAKDVPEAQALINNVSLYGCGHETPLDGLEKAHRDLEFHEDATKFMVLITDEPYIYSDNRYGIETMQDLANSLKDDTIYTSVVCYNSDASGYSPLYNTTNGIQINLASNWPVYLEEYIRTYIKELTSFKGFSMYNLTEITLDAAPEYGSNTNSDEDGFMDYEEIDWRFINKESDELILPTLNEYFIKTGQKNTFNMLPIGQRYRDKINSILILPILTDPTKTDTDGDGFSDKYVEELSSETYYPHDDPNPFISDVTETSLKNDFFSVDYKYYPEFAEENWSTVRNDNSNKSYGGYQGWMGKYGYTKDVKEFCNKSVTGNTMHSNGCGIIAVADMFMYMFISNNGYFNDGTSQIDIGNNFNNIKFTTYVNYVKSISNFFEMYDWPINGTVSDYLSGNLKKGIKSISSLNDLDLDVTWDNNTDSKKCFKKMKEMIKNDIPVVFSCNISDFLQLYRFKEHGYTTDGGETPNSHYMVATGIIEYSDDVETFVGRKKMVRIATYGKEYYMDFEDYADILSSIDTNIMYIKNEEK